MAKLWIREYSATGQATPSVYANRSAMPIAQEPGVDQAPITFTTHQESQAFAADTRYVTIISDAAFHYVVGASPVATTDHLPVPEWTEKSFGVPAGSKISVVAAA